MHDHIGAPTFVMLAHGYQAPKWLFDAIKKRVKEFVPFMLPGHRYTLETMCGNAFWDDLSPWFRTLAGRCMTYMAIHKLLPLVFADIGGKKTKQYQLR